MLPSGNGVQTRKVLSKIECFSLNLIMICPMVFLLLELLNQAANAVTASSVGAGRLLLAAAQLQACRQENNPHRSQWLPGMVATNLQWAQDPCQKEQEQLNNLLEQGAAAGNQVATQQLGGAPAPQLAEATDPTPNTDPAVPMNEFVVPEQGANNQWSPLIPEDVLDMIVDQYQGEEPPDVEMLDSIMEQMRYYLLWCPWGEPGQRNLKWNFKYRPRNSSWIASWLPK
ncbi:nucleoprotein [Chestnut teal chaphamaparvovirus 1]|uniref:Nucleoprotein n=1 Tax=Chestnut teal chaphamaparvovirus 1 TaxID=2759403 RepID=A0A7D6WX00_9VIRU|nr:nucleoprotein [Chestnut teal chaphamaparvovirus 1]QMI57830.1 nucleoprotein [Chestnut teal chaphamaparvovirus 1]